MHRRSSTGTSRLIRIAAMAALGFFLGACAGDGSTGPSGPALSVVLDSTTLQGGSIFTARLRGPRVDSLRTLMLDGTPLIGGLTDSTLVALLPAGPSGSATLRVEVWTSGTTRAATIALTRRAAAVVASPDSLIATTQNQFEATFTDLAGRTPPRGVAPEVYAEQIAQLRILQDSLTALVAGFTPEQRAAYAQLLAGWRASEDAAGLREAFNIDSCNAFTWRAARECLRQMQTAIQESNLKAQGKAAVSVALVAAGALSIAAAPVLAFAAIGIGLVGTIESRQVIADFATDKMERITAPAIIESLGFGNGNLQGIRAASGIASSVAPLTTIPGTPVPLPLVRVSRNAVLADSVLPIVKPLPPLLQGLRSYWQQLEEIWGFAVTPSPTFPTQPLRTLEEAPALEELTVVRIREGGAAATNVSATLLTSGGALALQLDGDPRTGRDLLVTVRVEGNDAGAASFDVPVRLNAPRDTLEWAVETLTTGGWLATWPIYNNGVTGQFEFDLCPDVFYPNQTTVTTYQLLPSPITAENAPDGLRSIDPTTSVRVPTVILRYRAQCRANDGTPDLERSYDLGYFAWFPGPRRFDAQFLWFSQGGMGVVDALTATSFSVSQIFNGSGGRYLFTR